MSSNTTHPLVTANNVGPAVNVISWFLGSTAVLFVIARLTTKVVLAQRIRIDDGLLITALLFSIGLVVDVSLETTLGGLGQHKSALSQTKLTAFQKAAYAGDLLYMLSLVFSKISLLTLLRLLTPVKLHIQLISALGAVISLWGITGFLAAAFQCHVPKVWATFSNQCFGTIAFWNYFGVVNLITESILIVLPLVIIWNVQMPWLRKLVIIWCFAVRTFVVGAIISELIFRNRIAGSDDITMAAWPVVICSQFVQALSIITACIPYLKPFFASLETGMIRTDDSRRLGSRSFWTYGSSKPNALNKGFSLRSIGSRTLKHSTHQSSHGATINSAESTDILGQDTRISETESQTSQTRIIRQTARQTAP